jgi:hypothetical protein
MRAAETALVRRDVVVEACLAMNVVPPPILGLVEGVSSEHRTPPEPPLDSRIAVFAREVEREQKLLRHRNVMPADKADGYTLLWDAAAKMSRANGRSLEWNWLRLMDAFWRGDLSPDGLIYFYPGQPGREFVFLDCMALGGLLLGHHNRDTAAANIENLRQWSVADYLGQPTPFGSFFQFHPEGRYGLAVLTRDFDRWHQGRAGANAVTVTVAPGPKGGGRKVDELAWDIALHILESEQKPKRGHGRLTALARMVEIELAKEGHKRLVESICKAIRRSLREWETKNPDQ